MLPRQWKDITDKFDAESDDGLVFRINEYTTMMDARSMSNPSAPPLDGLKSYRTADGQSCNKIDDDTFEILEPHGSVKVRRIT